MLFFVFGLPGRFTEWCEAVVMELARCTGGTAEVIGADTLEQVAISVLRTRASHAVVSSRRPGGRLRAALNSCRRNFIVARDEPRRALLDLVLDEKRGLAVAVQELASGCAALGDVADEPWVLALHGERDWSRPADAVAAIARHLGIKIDDAAVAALVERLAAQRPARPAYDATSWWNALDAAEQELVMGALMPFVDRGADGVELSVAWGYDLFFLGDQPQQRASGPIDITGRARCLLHGPHIVLPPGSWSMSLTALFSREAAEHEFVTEVCADRPLASGVMRPLPEGSAEITLDFVLDDSVEHPVAIRVSTQRAAFDGAIVMVGATLLRLAEPAPVAEPEATLAELADADYRSR